MSERDECRAAFARFEIRCRCVAEAAGTYPRRGSGAGRNRKVVYAINAINAINAKSVPRSESVTAAPLFRMPAAFWRAFLFGRVRFHVTGNAPRRAANVVGALATLHRRISWRGELTPCGAALLCAHDRQSKPTGFWNGEVTMHKYQSDSLNDYRNSLGTWMRGYEKELRTKVSRSLREKDGSIKCPPFPDGFKSGLIDSESLGRIILFCLGHIAFRDHQTAVPLNIVEEIMMRLFVLSKQKASFLPATNNAIEYLRRNDFIEFEARPVHRVLYLKLTQKGWNAVAPKLTRDIDFISSQKHGSLRGVVAYCAGGAWRDIAEQIRSRGHNDAKLTEKRFAVSLSFPGEYRDYVCDVDRHLSRILKREQVFYDDRYKDVLARLDLDDYLQNIYRYQSEPIVIFMCPEYEHKKWCKLEWRAIKDIISTADQHRIMLLTFNPVSLPGIFSGDGFLNLKGLTPNQTARAIAGRLEHNRKEFPERQRV